MNRIAELRKKHGLSQIELAHNLDIAQNTLSQYESGKRNIPVKTVDKLADFFNVPLNYLLGLPEISDQTNKDLLDVTLVKEIHEATEVNHYLKLGWKLLQVGFESFTAEEGAYSQLIYVVGFWGDPKNTIPDAPLEEPPKLGWGV